MNANTLRAALAVLAVCGTAPAALAQEMLTDANGMTLYTFDADTGGTPTCYDDCAAKWPPYLANEGDAMKEGWATVERTDGTKQWTYDGKPVYFYAEDKAKGDMAGDGMGGKWHVIKE
ncbi:hypothetical protein [Albidovulum sp.]|mgnify:CR=1 FL=1|jgi:predicted lipoprotein with Yx(FWY)xxD motif|uniref:COG4315 family predicted lipoprotein n=1 Tax=Albidovulum sp. TaxID=1872424 RepID=UPI00306305D8